MARFLVVLCLSSAVDLSSLLPLEFSVEQDGENGFSIKLDSVLVFKHTKDNPMATIGTGNTTFDETSGMPHIVDTSIEKIPLRKYDINLEEDDCTIQLTSDNDQVYVKFILKSEQDQNLVLSILESNGTFDRIWLRLAAEADEEVYGAGEQYSHFNLRENRSGSVYPIWAGEQGAGKNKGESNNNMTSERNLRASGGAYHTTNFVQPTYVSSRNLYVHHNGTNYAVLDFSKDTFFEIMIWGQMDSLFVHKEDTQEELIMSLSSLLGKMPKLPDWIQEGAILGVQGGSKRLLHQFHLALRNNIKVKAMWIQDWSGQKVTEFGQRVYWNWQLDKTHYKALKYQIKHFAAKYDVRVLAYINPHLATDSPLYKKAAQEGYLVKNSTDGVYINNSIATSSVAQEGSLVKNSTDGIYINSSIATSSASAAQEESLVKSSTGGVYIQRSNARSFASVDFTNPNAYIWYKSVIKENMIGLGFSGWMADFGEALPNDAVLHDGRLGVDVHNEWPVLWAKLNREAIEEAGKLGEVVFFTSSGFNGISKYTTLQTTNFELADGVPSTIHATLGMGMNGVTLSHFDIGGFTSRGKFDFNRTKEAFLRSAEYAVFTPVFRTHEGNEIQSNLLWHDEDLIKDFARLTKKFYCLREYRKWFVAEAANKGLPAMRPMSMVFEGFQTISDQYMFGTDLLVAPVYEQNVTERPVTLPPVDYEVAWYDIWNNKLYLGGQTIIHPAPLGQPPVFYRYRSIEYFRGDFTSCLLSTRH